MNTPIKPVLMAATITALVAGMSTAQADGHDLAFTPGEGPFSWDSYNAWAESAPNLSGQHVTVFGPWLNPEDDLFRSALAYFSKATGAPKNVR